MMKKHVLLIALLASASAIADEFVTMSNGMTCWRNQSGQLWGCSGGVNTRGTGFNNTRDGTRYEYANPQQAVDPRTGQPFNTPRYNDPYGRNR